MSVVNNAPKDADVPALAYTLQRVRLLQESPTLNWPKTVCSSRVGSSLTWCE